MYKLLFMTVLAFISLTNFSLVSNGGIEWHQTAVDLGEIEKDVPQLIEFQFSNRSDSPVLIVEAKTSCGCTLANYPKDPIEPGGIASINVKYDANNVGAFYKTIQIRAVNQEEWTVLSIKGTVVDLTKGR